MEEMMTYTHDEMLNNVIGLEGTPEREKYDAEVQSFLIGEAIREARKTKQMTQEDLGKLIGVKKGQISRIENGRNLTLSTISRIFKAMEIKVNLEIANLGKVALW